MSRSAFRKPAAGLTIRPPSPDSYGQTLNLPGRSGHDSPRRTALPPSPTHSTYSGLSGLSGVSGSGASSAGGSKSRRRSFEVPWATGGSSTGGSGVGADRPPPVPAKTEKRLPLPPGMSGMVVPPSPHKKASTDRGEFAGPGLYDNKLMSSTLSQLPPIPPLSPNPTGNSSMSNNSHHIASSHVVTPKPSFVSLSGLSLTSSYAPAASRPSLSVSTSSVGHHGSSMIVLPDGTTLATGSDGHDRSEGISIGRSMTETVAHSSPNSPWSLLTIHVLPLFAGSPLKTAIEDLNQLCHSHILATSQRTSASRLIAVLGSDLRDFIASGMLTLKAKIESAEDAKLIARTAEIWSFFWTHVLPYIEGVFLPISQLRDVPSASSGAASHQAISVRHLVLSGFLLHILLPLLPRLVPLVAMAQTYPPSASTDTSRSVAGSPAMTPDLQRVLQMGLVLSTQATYSSFFPSESPDELERKDAEVRISIEDLSRMVSWRLQAIKEAAAAAADAAARGDQGRTGEASLAAAAGTSGPSNGGTGGGLARPAPLQRNPSILQRGPSMSQGHRYRRSRNWKQQSTDTQAQMPGGIPESFQFSRQNSEFMQPEARWGRPRVDDDDDDDITPGHSLAPSRQDSYATTATGGTGTTGTSTSTITPGATIAREGASLLGEDQRTPQADFGRRAVRAGSFGQQHDLATPAVSEMRRQHRAI